MLLAFLFLLDFVFAFGLLLQLGKFLSQLLLVFHDFLLVDERVEAWGFVQTVDSVLEGSVSIRGGSVVAEVESVWLSLFVVCLQCLY